MKKDIIAEAFALGVLSQGGRISPDELAAVVAKLESRLKEGDHVQNFSYVSGKNWAISQARKRCAQQKRELEQMRKARIAAEEEARVQRLQAEFTRLYTSLAPTLRGLAANHLLILWLKYSLGQDEEQLAAAFPGTTELQRRQWACRGRRLLKPRATAELIAYLKQRER